MTDIEKTLHELIEGVKNTKEYNQYNSLLERIKNQPELYKRIGEYHKKSLTLQLYGSSDFIQEDNALQKEYADLRSNGLSSEFFAAEHQYCTMIRKMQELFLQSISIETDFLED